MNRSKRSENRSRILSSEGWQRLQDAIAEKFGEACRDKPPFQQLSNLSELPGERPLDPDTVSKIWHRKKGVYRSKLERLFTALELELNQSDHISFSEDLNTEILDSDTKAIAKPHQESVESDPGSIEARYFRATSNFDSLEPLERKSRIQVLEEIARDSPRYHWKVIEFLADFVRRKAPRKEEDEWEEEQSPTISEDIQAALTVIGQPEPEKDLLQEKDSSKKKRLNLSKIDIRGAILNEANLQGVILSKANLQGVNFYNANLQGAILREANLKKASFYNANLQEADPTPGADLTKANLQEACFLGAKLQGAFLSATNMQGVDLRGAKLKGASLNIANLERASLNGADLSRANLQGANFMGASLLEVDLAESNLQGTKLRGADLTNAKNLKLQQIESAYVDSTTALPNYLERFTH